MIRRILRSKALGALLLAAAPATAQYGERPADRLSRHLRELASDPNGLAALTGAGQASLDVGDGHAALGFFARADERAPRNGTVKAGLARAMLMTDQPREALQLFDEAKRLGVPELQLAGDRGLAHDLRGDNRRAQQDYALALGRGANDEVAKRYALSLGISGDREQALKLLDPLLYKRDQGAWRARAFVLAMTGDARGASAIVHQVMPQRMAQAMDQFLVKLAGLNAAQKAAAVHLGDMPASGRLAAAAPPPTAPTVRIASAPPPRRSAGVGALLAAPRPAPAAPQVVQASVSAPAPLSAPAPAVRGDLDAIMRDIREAAARPQLAAVSVPTPTRVAVAQVKPAPKPKAEAAKPDPKPALKKRPEEPKHTSRVWVQVAGGSNAGALPRAWTDVSGKLPELKGKGPWTARHRATNRLLAGPFKTAEEAQAAVSKLRKAGVGAFQWTSEDGEPVVKLAAK